MSRYGRENNRLKYIGAVILIVIAIVGVFTQVKTPMGNFDILKMVKMMNTTEDIGNLGFGFIDMSAISDVVGDMIRMLMVLIILSILLPLVEAVLALALRRSLLVPVIVMSIVVNLIVKGIFMGQISKVNSLISGTVLNFSGATVSVEPLSLGIWVALHLILAVIGIAAIIETRKSESKKELFRDDMRITEGPM